MKYLALITLVLLFSCTEKDTEDCYVCTITYIVTTDVPVSGYPATTSTDYKLCDMTSDQISNFEQTNKGTDSSVVSNVTYSSSFSTKCKHN